MESLEDAYSRYADMDPPPAPARTAVRRLTLPELPSAKYASSAIRNVWHDGEKFPGGFGPTELLVPDYWALRARSAALFSRNLYARGLIRRLVTNEINTGLHLEALPEEGVLGMERDGLAEWAENVENRFALWSKNRRLADAREQHTFGQLQALARREALVTGDVLVVLEQDARTKLPRIRLINGASVRTPPTQAMFEQRRIVHGVELDEQGRHVAYWIHQQEPGGFLLSNFTRPPQRLPTYGKTGRRIAWLLYGTDKRLDAVRGEPVLSLFLQSLKEIDRYRDAVQRKAALNAVLAMVVTKEQPTVGSRPIHGGAIRRGTDTTLDSTNEERTFNVMEMLPGVVVDELAVGEKVQGFHNQGTDEKFGEFEEAIIQAIAWAQEIPPEILRLSFSSNYSASQAAINEFKLYLNPVRAEFGANFNQHVFEEWLLSEALAQRIDAPQLIDAWRDPLRYDEHGAWVNAEWCGQIKPAVDVSKLVKAYASMVVEGFITRDRASRELTGTKFSKNAKQLRLENALIAEANKVIVDLTKPAPPPADEGDDDEGEGDPDDENGMDDAEPAAAERAPRKPLPGLGGLRVV